MTNPTTREMEEENIYIRLVEAALKAAAQECNRTMMFPGGRQESYAHHGVDAAATAIRSLDRAAIVASVTDHIRGATKMVLQQEQVEPTDAEILHIWAAHVGPISAAYPLSDDDKLAFARALLSANQGE